MKDNPVLPQAPTDHSGVAGDEPGIAADPADAEFEMDENGDDLAYMLLDRQEYQRWRTGWPSAPERHTPAHRPRAPAISHDETFAPTHACSENEEAMLQDTLGAFFRDKIITDVLARVKGGKEANVYCCQAHPSTGLELIAAKVYRPRAHRTMRNDAIYREGRLVLDKEGKGAVRDTRIVRALAKKTAFGLELATFGWIEHEHHVMRALHSWGADVPRPMGHVGRAILMEYLGDVHRPAPTMDRVRFSSRGEAQAVFERLLWHVELMLRHNWVHGDLSAFNVLVYDGRAHVIDFPQTVSAMHNPNAEWLLRRDMERLCGYFTRYGMEADGAALARDLWQRWLNMRW